ncbi:hypothetical protein AB0L41_48365 [Amycolatopsis mediterranei]|uniref:hypothetical protein n=1 Tax=Amycolatopsis mediterranei TaxID=33910 RepID=UPI003444725E
MPGIAIAEVTGMVRDGRSIAGLIDGAARQGLYGGLLLGVAEVTVLFISNLALPVAADQWTGRNPVGFGLLALYAAGFVLIGARGQRRAGTRWAGARAGAVAGFVVATLFVVAFSVLFNVFYTTTIQHPGHLAATHASLNGTLMGAVFVVPVLVSPMAALLGEIGGLFVVARRKWRPADS